MPRLILVLILLLLNACATSPQKPESVQKTPTPAVPQVKCIDCGVVQDIKMINSTETTAPKKPVLSGIVGGVVSKPASSKPVTRYEILIQMLNGKTVLVTQTMLSAGLRIGSKVRVSQGRILAVRP